MSCLTVAFFQDSSSLKTCPDFVSYAVEAMALLAGCMNQWIKCTLLIDLLLPFFRWELATTLRDVSDGVEVTKVRT